MVTPNEFYPDPASSGENHGNERNTRSVRNYTIKTVTLPDDHWAALEREALLALMPVDKLMAHAVRLMQLAVSELER